MIGFYSPPLMVRRVIYKGEIFPNYKGLKRFDSLQFKIPTIDRDVVGATKHIINVEVYVNGEYVDTIGLRRLQTILKEKIVVQPYARYTNSSGFKIKRV